MDDNKINYVTDLGILHLRAVPCPPDSCVVGLGKRLGFLVSEFRLLPGKNQWFSDELLRKAGIQNIGEVIIRLTDDGVHSDALRQYIKTSDSGVLIDPPYCHVFPHNDEQGHEVISVCYGHPQGMDAVRIYGHRTGGRQLPWK